MKAQREVIKLESLPVVPLPPHSKKEFLVIMGYDAGSPEDHGKMQQLVCSILG